MRVVGFGTYDTRAHPRVGVLLDGLRDHGDDVLEVNVPLNISTAERVAMVRRPWLSYRFLLRVLSCWRQLIVLSRPVRKAGGIDVVVVGYLGHFDVFLARLLFRRTPVVLDMLIFAADTSRDRGVTNRRKLALLDLLDRSAVRVANVVLVDTDESAQLVRATRRPKVVVSPVGAAHEWFDVGRQRQTRSTTTPARVVFFGLFTPLQGAPTIAAAAALLGDDVRVTIIGTGQDYPAAREAAGDAANIDWVDWVPADELPHLVGEHDVCLGIFGTSPKARRVVPNKVYEGLAAGCAVVTSDTDPQRRMLGDSVAYVPPGDAPALAETLRGLAADRQRLDALQASGRERATTLTPYSVVTHLRAEVHRRLQLRDAGQPVERGTQ